MPKIIFKDFGDENGDRVLMVAFRLSINGVDVTDHLTGSISVQYGQSGEENTLNFTLSNNNDKFVVKPQNIGLQQTNTATQQYADAHSYATKEPWTIHTLKEGAQPTFIDPKGFAYDESAKKKLMLDKIRRRVKVDGMKGNLSLDGKFVTNTGLEDVSLYEGMFTVGASVINVMDQVILFVQDPDRDVHSPKDLLWIPMFTGFVVSAPPQRDFNSGQSSISVSCTCVRSVIKRKRVLLNTAPATTWIPTIELKSGLFADAAATTNTMTQNALADSKYNFEGLISLLLMGVSLPDTNRSLRSYCLQEDLSNYSNWLREKQKFQKNTVNGPSEDESHGANNLGFGGFWFGCYFTYDVDKYGTSVDASSSGNPKRMAFLNQWNRLSVFGLHRRSGKTLRRVTEMNNNEDTTMSDLVGEDFTIGNTQAALKNGDKIVMDYYTTEEMLEVSRGTYPGGPYDALAKRVHFLFPSGGGKIANLIEQVFLKDFGVEREYQSVGEILQAICERIDYQMLVTGFGDIVFEFPMYDFTPLDMGEEFKSVYAVSDSVKSDEIDDEANSNPVNGLRVTGGFQTENSAQVDETVNQLVFTVFIRHDLLAYRYGLGVEDYPIPFIESGTIAERTQDEKIRLLTLFGCLEFIKRLTEMSNMQCDTSYNPFVRPNRPYIYNFGRRIATTQSVSTTFSFFSNVNTNVMCKYVRKIHETFGDFISFSGSRSIPLRYSDARKLDMFFDATTFTRMISELQAAGISVVLPKEIDANNYARDASSVDNVTHSDSNTPYNKGNVSRTKKSIEDRLCSWSDEDRKAFQSIAARQGVTEDALLRIILTESNGADPFALNKTAGKNGGKPTYTVGFNQMLPSSVIGVLESIPEMLQKYPEAASLTAPKYKEYYVRNGMRLYQVPHSLRQEFVDEYFRVFGTPKAQLEMFDAYLQYTKKISGMGQDEKIGSLNKLVMAQIAPGKMKSPYYKLTKNEQDVNPGIKDYDGDGMITTLDYEQLIRTKYNDATMAKYLKIVRNGCTETPAPKPTNTVPPALQPTPLTLDVRQKPSQSDATQIKLGGTGMHL